MLALRNRSTHLPEQSVLPVGQLDLHVPLEQTWPEPQTTPQLPQFDGSLLVLTQVLLHAVRPPVQLQTPARHAPPLQLLPQAPQFWLSHCV